MCLRAFGRLCLWFHLLGSDLEGFSRFSCRYISVERNSSLQSWFFINWGLGLKVMLWFRLNKRKFVFLGVFWLLDFVFDRAFGWTTALLWANTLRKRTEGTVGRILERFFFLLALGALDLNTESNAKRYIPVFFGFIFPLACNRMKFGIELLFEVCVQSEVSLIALVNRFCQLSVLLLLLFVRCRCRAHWTCEIPEISDHLRLCKDVLKFTLADSHWWDGWSLGVICITARIRRESLKAIEVKVSLLHG